MKHIALLVFCFLISIPFFAQEDSFKPYTQEIPGSEVSFKMVAIPGGEFLMGSPEDEEGRAAHEGPQTKVKVDSFWMEEHEVTYDEFKMFQSESNDTDPVVDAVARPTPQYVDLSWGMGKEGGYPVNSMSQYTALAYCQWLYEKTGDFYRLPTEAEWEYAGRADSKDAYHFGNDADDLEEYAWYAENSDDEYQKVKQLKPNEWGLYDMHGNLAEWTLDQFDEAYFDHVKDQNDNPQIPVEKRYPVTLKGGHYDASAEDLRSAARLASDKSWNARDPQTPKSKWWLTDAPFAGFRVVKPLNQPSKEEIEAFFDHYLN